MSKGIRRPPNSRRLGGAPLNKHEVRQLAGYLLTIERDYPRLSSQNIRAARHARIKEYVSRLFEQALIVEG